MAAAAAALASLALAASASAGMSFNNGKLIDSGNREIALELGNFTADAYPDVVTADGNNTDHLNILTAPMIGSSSRGAGPGPSRGRGVDVVSGDFDADGKLDAAFAAQSARQHERVPGRRRGRGYREANYPPPAPGRSKSRPALLNGDARPRPRHRQRGQHRPDLASLRLGLPRRRRRDVHRGGLGRDRRQCRAHQGSRDRRRDRRREAGHRRREQQHEQGRDPGRRRRRRVRALAHDLRHDAGSTQGGPRRLRRERQPRHRHRRLRRWRAVQPGEQEQQDHGAPEQRQRELQ